MRNQMVGGGVLAAGLMLVLGLVFVTGRGSTPAVHAQALECPDDQDVVRCVTISKAVDDDSDAPDFSFEFDSTAFTLGAGDQASFVLDDGGTHVVSESETEGWTLVDIDCSVGEGVALSEDTVTGSVTIQVTAADESDASVTCTFMNAQDAEPTATATTTAEATETAEATSTTEASSDATSTPTTESSANVPVAPTAIPFTPTPQPPASEVQSGTISPPTTGSGGLK